MRTLHLLVFSPFRIILRRNKKIKGTGVEGQVILFVVFFCEKTIQKSSLRNNRWLINKTVLSMIAENSRFFSEGRHTGISSIRRSLDCTAYTRYLNGMEIAISLIVVISSCWLISFQFFNQTHKIIFWKLTCCSPRYGEIRLPSRRQKSRRNSFVEGRAEVGEIRSNISLPVQPSDIQSGHPSKFWPEHEHGGSLTGIHIFL